MPGHRLTTEKEMEVQVVRTLLPSLDDEYLPAAIDCGTALIKIVYITDSVDAGVDKCSLHFAMFDPKRLDSALEFLKAKMKLPMEVSDADGVRKLRATGDGARLHGDRMREQLGVQIELVDESSSHCAGFHFLVSHCATADFCHPTPAIDDSGLAGIKHGDTFQQYLDAQVSMMGQQGSDSRFPCIFTVFSEAATVFLIHEDGSAEMKHQHALGGKSLLGACQLLTGAKDYGEVMQMASDGQRGNIDSQVRDLLADSPNSPYGQIPLSVSLFAFGKAVDFDKSIEDTRPEDVAQSLVSVFTANIGYPVSQLASYDGVRNVYYGGGFFRHEFPRAELIRSISLFAAPEAMNLNFLKVNHTAALGALLVNRIRKCSAESKAVIADKAASSASS